MSSRAFLQLQEKLVCGLSSITYHLSLSCISIERFLGPFVVHVYTDCPYKSSMVVRDVQETPVIPQRLRSRRNSRQDVLDSVSTQSTTPNLRKPFRHSVIAVTIAYERT